jgi:FtsP/CotA-like multicopper oxidase with cupredoxin domain
MNYDEDLGPILVSDWYHADAFSLYHEEVEGGPPVPNSNIMNGKGVYYCDPMVDAQCTGRQPRHQIYFEEEKTYKLSIVNTAVDTQFTFWIDGHNFTIVQTDFVPIKPYTTNTMNIGIGMSTALLKNAERS